MLDVRVILWAAVITGGCRAEATATPTPPPRASDGFDPNLAVSGELAPDQIRPPPDGWWKSERPCPDGTKLVELQAPPALSEVAKPTEIQAFQCHRPDGSTHGASTTIMKAEVTATGYYRDGERHGHWGPSESKSRPGTRSVMLYDAGVGIGTWRAYDGDRVTIREHRGAGEIYFTEQEPEGSRRAEGLLVDGLRSGPWIFGDGPEQRTVSYSEGKPAGVASISGVPECDAGVERWRQCLDTKQGGRRYEMAEWLAMYISMWELVAQLEGHDEPLCVTHMRIVPRQLAAYGCAGA